MGRGIGVYKILGTIGLPNTQLKNRPYLQQSGHINPKTYQLSQGLKIPTILAVLELVSGLKNMSKTHGRSQRSRVMDGE